MNGPVSNFSKFLDNDYSSNLKASWLVPVLAFPLNKTLVVHLKQEMFVSSYKAAATEQNLAASNTSRKQKPESSFLNQKKKCLDFNKCIQTLIIIGGPVAVSDFFLHQCDTIKVYSRFTLAKKFGRTIFSDISEATYHISRNLVCLYGTHAFSFLCEN